MTELKLKMMVSLDGYGCAPDISEDNPFGVGGMVLTEWITGLAAFRAMHGGEGGEDNASNRVVEHWFDNIGATVMGRGMFGGGPGPWDESWKGWWGDDPPYHHPVFVLTHHARDPLEMEGGTTFHFVTDGLESALEQARTAAAGKDVSLGGGPSTAREAIAKGLLDEMELALVPVFLGDGTRLLDGLGDAPRKPELVEAIQGPEVVHLRYRFL